MTALHTYCEQEKRKWPLLMAELAIKYLKDEQDETLTRMKFLCSVNLEGREAHLEEQRRVLLECLGEGGHDAIRREWYQDMYSRIQPNAFRLDLIDTPALQAGAENDYRAVLRGMLARQEGDESGSSVYTVASLFNHSCAPNVDVLFLKNDHDITMRTNQDVSKNQQLTISYIDHEMLDVEERARQLAMYGFTCHCERCREERGSSV